MAELGVHQDLIDRLDGATLADEAALLALAAAMGDDELADALEGTAPQRPAPADTDEAEPVALYLSAIEVEGFRGIAKTARLGLKPGAGLTLVVGRNGSGKSSFAEAVEFALTQENQRWTNKSKEWEKGWANLHHHGNRRIKVRLQQDGVNGLTDVQTTWPADGHLADANTKVMVPGQPTTDLASLGFTTALKAFKPILSYDDLGSILDDAPSTLYDNLNVLLGMDDWKTVRDRLKGQQSQLEALEKQVKASAASLKQELEEHATTDDADPRASQAVAALGKRGGADLEVLADLAGTGSGELDPELADLQRLRDLEGPDPEAARVIAQRIREAVAELAALAGSDAPRADSLARVLATALEFHQAHAGDDTCPVCGTGRLDANWVAETTDRLAEQQQLAARYTEATEAVRRAMAATRQLFIQFPPVIATPPPAVDTGSLIRAWAVWGEPPADPLKLADHLERHGDLLALEIAEVRAQAAAELGRREDRWRPYADALAQWLPAAKTAAAAKPRVKSLKEAAKWVDDTAAVVRQERFSPIAQQVRDRWEQLRADSSVSIDDLRLTGQATKRRLDVRVTVDDEAGSVAVLSQGELHALSLAMFLPRALQDASPFRFVLIDDPVQAFDATRVDGLARVLEDAARTRQVVVFTHDERLPAACRRLKIEAKVMEVSRAASSEVVVRAKDTPWNQLILDAFAIINTDGYPPSLLNRVVPGLCREAVEAACLVSGQQLLLAKGVPFADVDQRANELTRLLPHLSFGLFGEQRRDGETYAELRRRFGHDAANTIDALNRGSHEGEDAEDLAQSTRRLVNKLLPDLQVVR